MHFIVPDARCVQNQSGPHAFALRSFTTQWPNVPSDAQPCSTWADLVFELSACVAFPGVCMQTLTLIGLELDHLEDLELFTSLTASTQLKDVGIGGTYTSQPIPSGAIRYMLREGTQLPLLKTLELEVMDVDFSYQPPACVDTRDIKRMANCLPALEELSLIGVVQGHGAVAALTHLVPRLKRLRVSGDGFDDRGAALVAKLTSLDTLEWTNTNVSSHGLLKLTTLTGLKNLAVRDCPMLGPAMRIENVPNAGMMGRSPWEDQVALVSSEEVRKASRGAAIWLTSRHPHTCQRG